MNDTTIPAHSHNVTDLNLDAISSALASGASPFGVANDIPFLLGSTGQFVLKFDTTTAPDRLSLTGGGTISDTNGYDFYVILPDVASVTGARTGGGIIMRTGPATSNGNASGPSGDFVLMTGASASAGTGSLNLFTGDAATVSGSIDLTTGAASATETRGDVLSKSRAFQQPPIRTAGTLNMKLGTQPTLLVQDLADPATGSTSFAQIRAIRVARVWAIKDTNAGGAGDQIVVKNNAGSTICTLDLNVAANTLVNPATILTANVAIAAAANLTYTVTKATNAGCTLFIEVVPTGEAAYA